MIKVSELKGRAVIGLEHAQKIGALQGLVIDPHGARAVGLRVSGADAGSSFFVPAAALYNIGPDAITVREAGLTQAGGAQFPQEGFPDSHELANTKVVTDGGTLLGSITDLYVDPASLQLQGYELTGQGLENLFGRGKFLPALPGYRYGGELMLVPDSAAASVRQGAPEADREESPGGAAQRYAPAAAPPPAAPQRAAGVPAYSAPTEAVPQVSPAAQPELRAALAARPLGAEGQGIPGSVTLGPSAAPPNLPPAGPVTQPIQPLNSPPGAAPGAPAADQEPDR